MALREGAPGEGSGWGKEGAQKSDRERWRREIVRERVPLIGTDASLPRVECILESRCPKVLSLSIFAHLTHLSRSLALSPFHPRSLSISKGSVILFYLCLCLPSLQSPLHQSRTAAGLPLTRN